MSLEKLYENFRTYEMEQEERVIIYDSGEVESKNVTFLKTIALVVEKYLASK